MLELNVWIVYDADGNYSCHNAGPDEAMEKYADDIGGNCPRRCVKVKLQAPEPVVRVLTGIVPDENGEGVLTAY